MSLINIISVLSNSRALSGYNKTISSQSEFDALTIAANDKILINGSFEGTINVNQNNVLISGGTIKGSTEISQETWTDEGGGIYSIDIGQEVKWLYINGVSAKLAEYGATDLDTLISTNQISVDTGATSVIGAYAVNRNYKWAHTRGIKVTGQSGATKTLEFDRSIDDRSWRTISQAVSTMDGKVNFYGLETFITDNNDFAYTDKLYVKLASAPSNYSIKAVTEDQCINVTGTGCTIRNVNISEAFRGGITIGADNTTVSGCTISKIREHGIRNNVLTSNHNIVSNTVYDCDCGGIFMKALINITIEENTVHDIGNGVNASWLKDAYDVSIMVGCGIETAQSTNYVLDGSEYLTDFTVTKNTVYNILWCGIHGHLWSNGTITKNHVYNCMLKDYEDGGAIYYARQVEPLFTSGTPSFVGTGEISYNIIHDVSFGYSGQRHGIYMDNGSGNTEVHHNVIYNHDGGPAIYINEGSKLTQVNDNIIQGDGRDVFRIFNSAFLFAPTNFGHVYLRNIVAQLNSSYHCWITDGDGGSPFASGGSSDNNKYFTPYAANKVAPSNKSLASWQSTWATDASSTVKENWLTFVSQAQAREDVKVYSNPTDSPVNQLIPSGYEDVNGNDISETTIEIPAWYGLLILKS